MSKKELENLIKKFYLDGLVSAVKWEITDKNLKIRFMPSDNQTPSLLGTLESNLDLEDCTIGFFDVKKLLSMLKPLNDEIDIQLVYERNKPVSLSLTDKEIRSSVLLANLSVIQDVRQPRYDIEYDIELQLTKDFVTKFLKSKSAMSDGETVVGIIPDDNVVDFVLNHSELPTDKITITIPAMVKNNIGLTLFDMNLLASVLNNNSDFRTAKMSIYPNGMRIQFETEETITNYFIKGFERKS